jgi:hypothetical protein
MALVLQLLGGAFGLLLATDGSLLGWASFLFLCLLVGALIGAGQGEKA